MIFELIDSKRICDSCYANGHISPYSILSSLTHTWDYSPLFGEHRYELACIYAGTKTIEDACSNELRERYLLIRERLKAFMKSIATAHISLEENCFFDLIPISFLEEFFSIRKEILEDIFLKFKRPSNYDHLYDLNKMLFGIAEKTVKINANNLQNGSVKHQIDVHKSMSNLPTKTRYKLFGAVTGRLTDEKDSFPVLRLAKDSRAIVEPTNGFLLELDFNAFEPRVLMALNNKKQPLVDLHEWNRENIFIGMVSRDDAKKKFLTWLYDEKGGHILTPNQEKKAVSFYDKSYIKNKYYDGNIVKNFYERTIIADAEHALSYIVQSTASDVFLRQAIKIDKFLEGKKSFVKFLVHDSVVIDMAVEEKDLIKDIFDIFSNTDFGRFMISKKVGKNYGNMRAL